MKDSIQEQLIAARRNQILDAATKVFAEKGFHPTTIKGVINHDEERYCHSNHTREINLTF